MSPDSYTVWDLNYTVNMAYNRAHQSYSVFVSPGAAVGHAVLNTTHTCLLVAHVHHTRTAHPAAKGRTHRLLMHNNSYKNSQEIRSVSNDYKS